MQVDANLDGPITAAELDAELLPEREALSSFININITVTPVVAVAQAFSVQAFTFGSSSVAWVNQLLAL